MADTEHSQTASSPPQGQKIYTITGDVGAGAQVAMGEHIQQLNRALAAVPEGDELARQFAELFERIAADTNLDDVTRDLAIEKTQAVGESLAQAKTSPSKLQRAILDAKGVLSTSVSWAWDGLNGILKSEAAQKTIGTIAEASTRAAISSLTGGR